MAERSELDIFHNNLRILLNIDAEELFEEGIFDPIRGVEDPQKWAQFRADPFMFFIRTDDETAKKLWSIIQSKQPKPRN